MHRRRFVQLGIAALLTAAAGFLVTGFSRLVVSSDTALVLGAPLLFGGFVMACGAFLLAVLATTSVIELETDEA